MISIMSSRSRSSHQLVGHHPGRTAFTLIELLVVVGIIAILAALLLPTLNRAKAAGKKAACISNLHQIDIAILMYVDEHSDAIHALTNKEELEYTYKKSIQPYLSRTASSTNDALFACPADDFDCAIPAIQDFFLFDNVSGKSFCHLKETLHSSYFFNGTGPDSPETRMAEKTFSSAREPSRLVVVAEISAAIGLSAHDRKRPQQFHDAKNVMAFVDGHVGFMPIYWNGQNGIDNLPVFYNPPESYGYAWFGK